MSDFEVLEVRFHFNGDFVLDGSKMLYCNGDWGVSHIEKDKIFSLIAVYSFLTVFDDTNVISTV